MKNRLIEILEIFDKYNINPKYPIWAEHGVIGFNVDYTEVSKEDIEYLDELGVFFSNEYESLIMFV